MKRAPPRPARYRDLLAKRRSDDRAAARAERARAERETILTRIAQRHGIETLETRKSDRLDFHDIAVWTLAEALRDAFDAGRASTACVVVNARGELVRVSIPGKESE